MQILRTAEAVQHFVEMKRGAEVGRLVVERMEELMDEDISMEDLVVFVILESGDGIEQLQDQLNLRVTTDLGSHLWEVIEEHSTCYELVFVLSSSGYGTFVFSPKAEAAPDILTLCQEHAYQSPPCLPPDAIGAPVATDTAHRGGFLLPVQKGNR